MTTPTVHLPVFSGLPTSVVVDLDGTLLDAEGALRSRTRGAIMRLIEASIPVVLATARPMRSVRVRIGEELLERVHVVQMNGAALRSPRSPLSSDVLSIPPQKLSPGTALHLVALASELAPGARVVAEIEGDVFGCDMALDPETLWRTNSATPEMLISLAEAFERGAAKVAMNGLGRPLGELGDRIRSELGALVDVIEEASGSFLNVVPRGVSKEAALCRLLGESPWPGMLAFGDDLADLEMLRAADHGVAMANAHPAVLEAARFRTLSNVDDGVAHVLEPLLDRFG